MVDGRWCNGLSDERLRLLGNQVAVVWVFDHDRMVTAVLGDAVGRCST